MIILSNKNGVMQMNKLFVVILMSLFLNGCSGPLRNTQHEKIVQGKISKDIYYHPRGIYSFKIPKLLSNVKIEEGFLDNKSMVAISDDFGNLVRVDTITHTEEEMVVFSALRNQLSFEDALKYVFNDCVFEVIAQQFQGTCFGEEQFLTIGGVGRVYCSIVKIPKGSNVINADTGEHCDSKRAFMLFFNKNQLVVLSAQESLLAQNAREFSKRTGGEPKENNQCLYDTLVELAKSYKNLEAYEGITIVKNRPKETIILKLPHEKNWKELFRCQQDDFAFVGNVPVDKAEAIGDLILMQYIKKSVVTDSSEDIETILALLSTITPCGARTKTIKLNILDKTKDDITYELFADISEKPFQQHEVGRFFLRDNAFHHIAILKVGSTTNEERQKQLTLLKDNICIMPFEEASKSDGLSLAKIREKY